MTIDFEGLEKKLMKEDKHGMVYILGMINHKDYFHMFCYDWLKPKVKQHLLDNKEHWHKLKNSPPYKEFFKD